MNQYPPQDPNYPPYQGGQPQYPQQPAYPAYPQTPQPQYPQTPQPQPQYPQAPTQPQYPGYGAPGQPSQYGMQAPQSQYGYPQAPGYPGGPGMAPAPAPASNRGAVTGIGIAAVVVVLVVIGVFVLHNMSGTSFTGQWYGALRFSPASGTSYQAYTAEVYLNLTQNSSSLSGSGDICVNLNGSVQNVPISTFSGTVNGSSATFDLAGGSTTESATLTLSGGNMSFSSTDNTGTTAGTLQNGGSSAQSNYNSACQALPPLQTGG